jgi:hypothetical protein
MVWPGPRLGQICVLHRDSRYSSRGANMLTIGGLLQMSWEVGEVLRAARCILQVLAD